MPKPVDKQVDLPQAADHHMSPKAQEHLPEHLQQNSVPPAPDVNVIFNSLGTSTIGGTPGADVFVFDMDLYPIDRFSSDQITGFQPGIDVIAFVDITPGTGTTFGHLTFARQGSAAMQVDAIVTLGPTDVSFSTTGTVTLQNGFTYLLADLM